MASGTAEQTALNELTIPVEDTQAEFFKGPLGSHRNYLTYIAFPNVVEYFSCKKGNEENGNATTPGKYGELRLFLNAVESLNNTLDYLYWEHQSRITKDFDEYRKTVLRAVPALNGLADLANAYKHCRRHNLSLRHAADLQKTVLNLHLRVGEPIRGDYQFSGPLPEDERTLNEAFSFWLRHLNSPDSSTLDELIAA